MNMRKLSAFAFSVGAVILPHGAMAQDESTRPLTFEAAYTFDGFSNLAGGVARGSRFLDNVDVTVTGDLDGLLGWRGATLFLYGLGNQGRSPSELIGDAQTVSNIDAPNSWRLYEAWIEQSWKEGAASVKAGLYDLNSEFDAIETGGLFLNSSHGIGPDFSQTGLNGPSIFPVTSLGFRIRAHLSDNFSVQAVVLDGVPGEPEDPTGTKIHLSREDGVLLVGEVGYLGGGLGFLFPYGVRLAAGGYLYTRTFDCLPDAGGELVPGGRDGSGGGYVLAEAEIHREAGSDEEGAALFARTGWADRRVNQFGSYLGGGIVYTGLLPGRGGDRFGVAVAVAMNTREFRMVSARSGERLDWAETAIEVTYRVGLPNGMVLQPDIQYIVNPGTHANVGNALAIGLRTSMAF